MHVIKPGRRHLVGVASLTCSFAFASLTFASSAGAQTVSVAPTATACPVLSLGNPNPGDTINAGGYVISGTAYDPAAMTGSGIARVDLFLGQRDSGGQPLGSAVPGSVAGADPKAFSIEVTVPSINRGVDFAAYAVSAISGQETEISFPVFVGTPDKTFGATPTPVPTTESVTSSCPRTPAVASGVPAAPVMASAPAAPAMAIATPAAMTTGALAGGAGVTTSAPVANACPVLSVGNPNPADDLTAGGYLISGIAYDPSASTGSGVSRVDLFLGERDSGGTPLGSVIPGSSGMGDPRAFSIEVQIPGINRGEDFAAYATSAITGQQTVVTFPVFVGTPARAGAATPTPIPSVETVTTTCSSRAA